MAGTRPAQRERTANPWNPNRMDEATRAKIVTSMRTEGFTQPLVVRPNPTGATPWQIIDGEHRWRVAGEIFSKPSLTYIDVGPISDTQAKTLTARMNALRGEFDAIALARMVSEINDDIGLEAAESLLPWTTERLTSMVDMHNAGMGIDPGILDGSLAGAESGVGGGASDADDFKGFDTAKAEFEHRCPKCGFQFNG